MLQKQSVDKKYTVQSCINMNRLVSRRNEIFFILTTIYMLTTILFTICFLFLYHLFKKYYFLKSFSDPISQPHITKYTPPVEFDDSLKDELLKDLELSVQE